MAVAAFKSSSRRPTSSSSSSSSFKETKDSPTSPRKKNSLNKPHPTPRRSRSVSAVPRSHLETSTSSDFLIKRDNPLYWSNVSPPDIETQQHSTPVVITKSFDDDNDNRRGRSVSRNDDVGKFFSQNRKETGRSLSRGAVARTHFFNAESDVEQQRGSSSSKYKNRNDFGRGSVVESKSNLIRSSSSDAIDRIESLHRPTSSSSLNLPSSSNSSWEDGVFATSFSEAEERTSRAIYEKMKLSQDCDLGGDTSSQIYETVRSEVRRAIADIQNDLESRE